MKKIRTSLKKQNNNKEQQQTEEQTVLFQVKTSFQRFGRMRGRKREREKRKIENFKKI